MANFDKQFARLLLEICRYTYAASFRHADEVEDALKWINGQPAKPSLTRLLHDDHPLPTSVACVFSYPDKNIVAYMGTKTELDEATDAAETIKDWLKNFRALPVPFRLSKSQLGTDQDRVLEGKVHEGFLDELKAVQDQVVEVLLQNGGKQRPLYVTGHSQGGAEATLATRAFLVGGFNVGAAYTFAAPRSGDQKFAASIPVDLPFHRLEFGDDIVPHVPPTLVHKAVRKISALRRLPLLPDYVREFLELLTDDLGYAGVGRLCYGSNETRKLQVDMDHEQEAEIFNDRLEHLVTHPKNWAKHHHLAGTKAEVEAGRKGNYTALVSEFA